MALTGVEKHIRGTCLRDAQEVADPPWQMQGPIGCHRMAGLS